MLYGNYAFCTMSGHKWDDKNYTQWFQLQHLIYKCALGSYFIVNKICSSEFSDHTVYYI